MLGLLVLALGVGIAVGTVGVGGILLAPLLTYVGGLELHRAMATSMWSFLFVGAAGTILYARRGSVSWPLVRMIAAGVVPTALLGAWTNGRVGTSALTVLLAVLCVATGLTTVWRPPAADRNPSDLRHGLSVALGAFAGFGSGLTGTSGPVLLVPLLLTAHVPALAAIGASQALQVPVALFATLGYLASGQVDVGLGTLLGLAEVAGVIVGVRLAHAAPPLALRRLVAAAVVGAGALMLGRLTLGG